MINFAKFEIIGRIGEIDARPKVTLLSVCANCRRKGDDDEWQEDRSTNSLLSKNIFQLAFISLDHGLSCPLVYCFPHHVWYSALILM